MENQTYFRNLIADAVKERDAKKRTMTVIVSNEDMNRYGHVVKVDGWNYKNYMKNPVVLINHDSNMLPVARATKVWKSKKFKSLMANIEFVPEGVSPEADLAFALYDNDFMTSVSPGYLVDYDKAEYGKDDKSPRITFNSQELLEISLATVPANPGALKQQSYIQNALELGVIDQDLLEKIHIDIYEEEDEYDVMEIENKDTIEETVQDTDENTEQNINEDIVDLTNEDNQQDSLEEHKDDFADFYKALEEINQEQLINNDIDLLTDKLIESFQDENPDENQSDDFDAWLKQYLS